MSYLDQLLDLLFTTYGLVGSVIALLFITYLHKEKYRPLHWFLLSLCAFAASLGEFRSQWMTEPPPLVFPLQQLRANGRPLTIALLGLLLIVVFISDNKHYREVIPSPLPYLITVQGVIFLKTILEGNFSFAILALLTFSAVVMVMVKGSAQWLETEADFQWGVRAIAIAGVIFAVVNLYQGAINLSAITFVKGRLLGTTGNPQMAGIVLSLTIPCFLFLIEEEKQQLWLKNFWIVFLTIVSLGLIMTGSRTSLIATVISIVAFYGFSSKIFIRIAWVSLGLLLISCLFEPAQQWFIDNFSVATNRFSNFSIENRERVWLAQWRTFINYPLFGAPLRGERLGYGENSWLATGASLGLLGFIPLLLFGRECLTMMVKLHQYGTSQPTYQLHCHLVIAGLAGLLAASIGEAYLLGNLTFPLFALLQYLVLGNFLLQHQHQAEEEQNIRLKTSTYS